jgi:hypothetical protein
MDLDLDLSSLGLRSSKERTLGALKKSAAAAATPVRPAVPPVGAGLGTPGLFSVGPGHHAPPPLPPLPTALQSSLSAGLDALAGFGSPLPAALRPTQQHAAAAPVTTPGLTRGASVEDLLGDFLATPSLSRCDASRASRNALAAAAQRSGARERGGIKPATHAAHGMPRGASAPHPSAASRGARQPGSACSSS